MGSTIGVYKDKEVEDLTDADKSLLKEHILNHIQTSPEIRRIVSANPRLLRKLTKNPQINKVLRQKTGSLQKRLKKRAKK
jgi:hypothetical protein